MFHCDDFDYKLLNLYKAGSILPPRDENHPERSQRLLYGSVDTGSWDGSTGWYFWEQTEPKGTRVFWDGPGYYISDPDDDRTYYPAYGDDVLWVIKSDYDELRRSEDDSIPTNQDILRYLGIEPEDEEDDDFDDEDWPGTADD